MFISVRSITDPLCGSAGAIHSPQILLLSGIGPAADLSKFGISLVADLPVGANLMDHVCLATRFRARPGLGLNYDTSTSPLGILSRFGKYLQWLSLGTGSLSSNCAESAAFYSSTDPVLFPDPPFPQSHSRQETSPDLETISVPFFAHHEGNPPPGEFLSLITVLLRLVGFDSMVSAPCQLSLVGLLVADPSRCGQPIPLTHQSLTRGLRMFMVQTDMSPDSARQVSRHKT